jgi:hypothetical protein
MPNKLKTVRTLAMVGITVQALLTGWVALSSVTFLTGARYFVRSQLQGQELPLLSSALFGVLDYLPKSGDFFFFLLADIFAIVIAVGYLLLRTSPNGIVLMARMGLFTVVLFSLLVAWLCFMLVCVALPFIMVITKLGG